MFENNKNKLAAQLKSNGAFWSYNNLNNITDNLLIEETLRYGDVDDIIFLFSIFSRRLIKKVWENTVIPDKRLFKHNYYLAVVYFNIENPIKYINQIQQKNSRYERIKKSLTRN